MFSATRVIAAVAIVALGGGACSWPLVRAVTVPMPTTPPAHLPSATARLDAGTGPALQWERVSLDFPLGKLRVKLDGDRFALWTPTMSSASRVMASPGRRRPIGGVGQARGPFGDGVVSWNGSCSLRLKRADGSVDAARLPAALERLAVSPTAILAVEAWPSETSSRMCSGRSRVWRLVRRLPGEPPGPCARLR